MPATPVRLSAACSAGFLWGTGALVVNLLITRHGFTPANISFWRFVIGSIVLLSVFGRPRLWQTLRPILPTVLVAGTAMAGYVLCWFLGIERIGAAVPTLIALCLPPIIVTVIALLRGQERLDANLVIVLGTALVGTAFIVLRDDASSIGKGQMLVGVLFSFVSACLYAAFTLVNGKLSTALGAGPATTCLTVVAALVMGLCAFFEPLNWPTGVPPQAWFLYLGVVTAALALLAFNWGAAKLSPTALTVATLVEPLTAVLLAALFFGEQLELRQWLGGALLLASIGGLGRRLANG
jgi:drug/metabolite transporter, DME family